MNISTIIIYIMLVFMAIGAVDYCILGDKLGLGKEFEDGIGAMGTLAISMAGMMAIAPVLGNLLTPIIAPLYSAVGSDPAMFAGTLLAIDMGGLPLAQQMTTNVDVQKLSGIILGSMMGATIVFSIPVSIGIVKKEDMPFLAKGILAGIIAIPFASFVGGLMLGISPLETFKNLIPVFIIAILLAVGLALIPSGLMKGFNVFSKIVSIVSVLSFACAIIEKLTESRLVIIKGMTPIDEVFMTVGIIAVTLAGAYPLVKIITKFLSKPLSALGKLIGVNDKTIAGMIATLANNIPMFGMMKDMDNRGKVLAVAFSVPAAFALGDHLGYTAGAAPNDVFPMIVSKIFGGILAIIIASFFVPKKSEQPKTSK